MNKLTDILKDVAEGKILPEEATEAIRKLQSVHLGHTQVDIDRHARTGCPEVIYGAGKTPEQILEISASLIDHGQNVLVTRIRPEAGMAFLSQYPDAEYHENAALVRYMPFPRPESENFIAVISAGPSDHQWAAEAALAADVLGLRPHRF